MQPSPSAPDPPTKLDMSRLYIGNDSRRAIEVECEGDPFRALPPDYLRKFIHIPEYARVRLLGTRTPLRVISGVHGKSGSFCLPPVQVLGFANLERLKVLSPSIVPLLLSIISSASASALERLGAQSRQPFRWVATTTICSSWRNNSPCPLHPAYFTSCALSPPELPHVPSLSCG
jgi:hypothetical protein